MTEIKAIFFDVANTLLYKPKVYSAIQNVLLDHKVAVPYPSLIAAHRLLSETIIFPDKTSSDFYREFNSHLLRSFGVVPTERLLDTLFSACSYLPWEAFSDVDFLSSIKVPMGVLSNWDRSLQEKLPLIANTSFDWILGSAEQGVRKPDLTFFQKIIEATGMQAEEIVYVGDSMRLDIEPALSLGMKAVLIDRDDLYPHATVQRVKSLHEVAQLYDVALSAS